MKIRPARSIDAPALAELIAARVPDTCYAGRDEVDLVYARKMFGFAAHRHGGVHDGATFLMVAEDEAGEIAGFVMGSLGRVYGVGKKLCATDNYLLGRQGCPARVLISLFREYLKWATSNPKVVEVGASWSDALAGSDAMGKFYELEGFTRCAVTYRKVTRPTSGGENA